MQPDTEAVLALAPDAGSAKAARGLVKPAKWPTLGANDAAVWGECQGSGSKPYQTQVDLSGPAFRCTCPSRKFPCKHGLALLLLRAGEPGLFSPSAPPAWVEEWLATRAARAQKQAQKQQAAARAADPQAVQRQEARRWARIEAGVAELAQWLADQIARGLGNLPPDSRVRWEAMAARLVDAQAPGLAQRVRDAAAELQQGPDWPERVLRQLGLLHLACEAVPRRESLPAPVQDDLRTVLGWARDKAEVLARAEPVPDLWIVLGQIREEREPNLLERRVWLHGLHSGRRALILEHAHGGRGFETHWPDGAALRIPLAFYPGAAALRALPVTVPEAPQAHPWPTVQAEAEWRTVAERVAASPWVPLHPVLCDGTPEITAGGRCRLHHQGRQLALCLREVDRWSLLALSGGHPIELMGEWDGHVLQPLAACGPDGYWRRSVS